MPRITLALGDITQTIPAGAERIAIVNAANTGLWAGGGVSGAIHRAAGPHLAEACNTYPAIANAPIVPRMRGDTSPIRCLPGDAVFTRAFDLPHDYVIHAVGPIYAAHGRREAARLLARAYTASLALAYNLGCDAVLFPALSTGIYGYPLAEAAQVAVDAVVKGLAAVDEVVETVTFVLFDRATFDLFRHVLGGDTLDLPAAAGIAGE